MSIDQLKAEKAEQNWFTETNLKFIVKLIELTKSDAHSRIVGNA